MRASKSVITHRGNDIKLDDIIPDLTFSKFTGLRLEYSEIKILVHKFPIHWIAVHFFVRLLFSFSCCSLLSLRSIFLLFIRSFLTLRQSSLDKGGYSNVYKGVISLNGKKKEVAIKELIFTTIATRKERLKLFYEFRHEVLVQGQLKHPNICQIYGKYTNYSWICFLFWLTLWFSHLQQASVFSLRTTWRRITWRSRVGPFYQHVLGTTLADRSRHWKRLEVHAQYVVLWKIFDGFIPLTYSVTIHILTGITNPLTTGGAQLTLNFNCSIPVFR